MNIITHLTKNNLIKDLMKSSLKNQQKKKMNLLAQLVNKKQHKRELLEEYFKYQRPTDMLKCLYRIENTDKNNR